ncbi:MAG TPA: PilZ domain-containing protein [Polyangiaceae bacterium]|nr:PilZ domain-containing protein [Polyangiaceae bacterium]
MRRSTKTPRGTSRHTVKIACQVVRERDFRLVADRMVDLSATGALVGPADPALTGERILVSFRIPRSSVWIDAEATVTRVVHGRRPGEFSRSLAIEFDDLEAFPRFMLEEALRSVPPAPPKSAPGRRSSPSLVRGLLQ